MSTHQPHDLQDDRFAAAYGALVDGLGTVLDLSTGAGEATHSATYGALTTDLATALDVDAGLTAIFGGPTPPPPLAGGAAFTTDIPRPGRRMTDQLSSLSDPERLRLRGRASYRRFRLAVAVIPNVDRAHDLGTAHALVQALALDLARDLARIYNLDLDLDLARSLTVTLGDDLARARGRSRAKDRDLARVRDRAYDLVRALARVLARDLANGVAHAYTLAHELALDLDLTSTGIAGLLECLSEVGDNFMGADLRAVVDFDSSDWDGIRWSPDTAWPPGWADRVRAISIEITPGIFRVVQDGRPSLHEAGT